MKHSYLPAFTVLLAAVAGASGLRPVGVIGNSGIEGSGLIRAGAAESQGGVCLDQDLTLWFSGGDRIINATFDGRLIRQVPLAPACKELWGQYFAALDGVLYFGGRGDKLTAGPIPSWGALFALPMKPDGVVGKVCGIDGAGGGDDMVLCPLPIGKELLVARHVPDGANAGAGVFFLNPVTKEFRPFKVYPGIPPQPGAPPTTIRSIAFDPARKAIYVGGYFGKTNVGRLHSPRVYEFFQYDVEGKELWRRDTIYLGTSVDPRGWLSFAGGAAWVTAWHGHMIRMDRSFAAAPGVVASWNFELNTPHQLIGVRDAGAPCIQAPVSGSPALRYDPLVIATERPFVYFARWDRRDRQLQLARRVGSLPSVSSVNISPDGWVSVGVGPCDQSWWRWEDGPDAPPRFANLAMAASSGAFDDRGWLCCLVPSPYSKSWTTGVFAPITSAHSADINPDNLVPFEPGGFGVRQGTRLFYSGVNAREMKVATAYATSGAGILPAGGRDARPANGREKGIWTCPIDTYAWKAAGRDKWKTIPVSGVALAEPGEIAMLEGSAMAVVDDGSVVFLREAGDKLEFVARLAAWGDAPDQSFGKEIHIAADGPNLLVADTRRHRVLWFNADTRRLIGQLGDTDKPGASLRAFDRPTCLGTRGNRLAVYDAGNQRIVKAELIE